MSKGLLVARREFDENVRTKTFWIGIIAFPIMLVLMMVVPRLLEKAKDVRRYAVIDNSGWLLEAVDERAQYDDVYRMLSYLRKQAIKGEAALKKLPEPLRVQAAALKDATNGNLEAQATFATVLGQSFLGGKKSSGDASAESDLSSEELDEEQKKLVRDSFNWMASLSPEEARELNAGIKLADYERVEIPEDVVDPEEWCREQLNASDNALFAYFVVGSDPLGSLISEVEDAKTSAEEVGTPAEDAEASEETDSRSGHKYVSNNQTDEGLRSWFQRLATSEVVARRFEREGVDQDVAERIQAEFSFDSKQVNEDTGEESDVSTEDIARQWAPVVFVYLLWIAIFTIVQMLLTNTVEEKSNRIIEVLLSSISPLELMTGKILGIAATGLTVVVSWVFFFLLALKLAPTLMDMGDMPDLSFLVADPVFLGSFIAYFLLGYMLYAAILVGLGSVCNSLKEAQNLMTPIMIVLMLPLAAMVPVGKDPNGSLAFFLSFIPPFTPFVMMNRAAGPPETWEYVVTTLLLLVSIAVAFWAAAKVFRIGVLMTGKAPKPSEILRWIRSPVGVVPDRGDE